MTAHVPGEPSTSQVESRAARTPPRRQRGVTCARRPHTRHTSLDLPREASVDRPRCDRAATADSRGLPPLLTPADVAELLRTTTKAVYAMVQRVQLPGTVRIGRRLLFRRDELLAHLGLIGSDAE